MSSFVKRCRARDATTTIRYESKSLLSRRLIFLVLLLYRTCIQVTVGLWFEHFSTFKI
jgi:hypothetical protein